jgi:hypothetical protein
MSFLPKLLPIALLVALPAIAHANPEPSGLSLKPRSGDSAGVAVTKGANKPTPPKLPPPTWGSIPEDAVPDASTGGTGADATSAALPKSENPSPVPEPTAISAGTSRPLGAVTGQSKGGTKASKKSKATAGKVQGSSPKAGTKAKASASGKKRAKQARRGPKASPICDYRTPVHHHTVEDGEHLGLIAGRYGIYRRDLVRTNPDLKNPDLIRPGQRINVCPELPPREKIELTHVIGEGDTLLGVAKTHELSLEELLELQPKPISDPNSVFVGQKIHIVKDGEILVGFRPDAPKPGRLGTSVMLASADHYVIKRPKLAFGTKRTVSLIQRTLSSYRAHAKGGPKIHVGDISRQGGGPLKGHKSHQRGIDVDVGLVLKGQDADETRFLRGTTKNLDVRRTWLLVNEFLETGEVRYIFLDYSVQKMLYDYAKDHGVSDQKLDEYFQYPRGRGRNHGIVRHWRGHKNHIHVRFRR